MASAGSHTRRPKATPATDNLAAIAKLEAIDSELASASLSLDAGEPADLVGGRPAPGVDALIARIEDSPKRAINTYYVEGWRRYNERVIPEYSFNFVPNRHLFAIMSGPDATPIIHYSIELDPASFGLETDEDQSRYYTTLDVDVEVRNNDNVIVHATSRSTFVELTAEQVATIETSPIAYQDDFPLVPGTYSTAVILKNRALKNYTVAEAKLEVVDPGATPTIVDLILCRAASVSSDPVEPNEIRTFQYADLRLEPATGGVFAIGDTITVFAQTLAVPAGARIVFELLSEEAVLDSDSDTRIGELSTLGLDGGNYQLRARLVPVGPVLKSASSGSNRW